MASSKDLIETQDTQLSMTSDFSPYCQDGVAPGFEVEVEKEDLILPRIKLMQRTTPEFGKVNGVNYGDIFLNLSLEKVSPYFIPIAHFYEYIKWNPQKKSDPGFVEGFDPGSMVWKTRDANDPRTAESRFTNNREAPKATKILNFIALADGLPGPAVISFKGMSYNAGRLMLNTIRMMPDRPYFSHRFELGSEEKDKNGNKFMVFTTAKIGNASKEEMDRCYKIWKSLQGRIHEINTEVDDE